MIIAVAEGVVVDEKTVGIWFVSTLPKQDWLCIVREVEPDKAYEIVYRFRYYEDDKAFESDDKKNWYKGTCNQTRAYVIASMRAVADVMYHVSKIEEPYELLNDGDLTKFRNDFMNAPFVFARLEKVK